MVEESWHAMKPPFLILKVSSNKLGVRVLVLMAWGRFEYIHGSPFVPEPVWSAWVSRECRIWNQGECCPVRKEVWSMRVRKRSDGGGVREYGVCGGSMEGRDVWSMLGWE